MFFTSVTLPLPPSCLDLCFLTLCFYGYMLYALTVMGQKGRILCKNPLDPLLHSPVM